MTRDGGLVLTGGESRRLGVDKASLILDGETLAARAARMLSERLEAVLEVGRGCTGLTAVRESPAGSGPLAALVTGAAALAATGAVGSVMLLACDLPRVAPALDALLAVPTSPGVVVPLDERGRRQYVCARYGPTALVLATTLVAEGERSLRAVVEALADAEVIEIDGFASGVFADIDVPDDALRAGIDLPR